MDRICLPPGFNNHINFQMRITIKELSKLVKFFYIQRFKGFSSPGNEPYMPPAEIARFKEEISKAQRYLEFGSGGSTVYANSKGISTISVESDRFYARTVASCLDGDCVKQIVPAMGVTCEWGMPVFRSMRKAKRYVMAPWGIEPFPDFILVDGRYRVACVLESARRAHEAGVAVVLMLDDYSTRPNYNIVEKFLGQPEIVGRAAIFCIGSQSVPLSAVEIWMQDIA